MGPNCTCESLLINIDLLGKNFVAYLNRGLGIFLIWDFKGFGIWKIVLDILDFG